jgi:hypothetical protein
VQARQHSRGYPAPCERQLEKNLWRLQKLAERKCLWHLEGNHTTEQCYQLRQAPKDTPDPQPPHDKKGKKKGDKGKDDFQELDNMVNVLFGGLPSRRSQKATPLYEDASNYATRWLAELPHVVWGLRTQVSSTTGFSPFFLVYGSEAILPTDVTFDAPRIQFYEEGEAEQTRRIDTDSLLEQRLTAVTRQARHDQQLHRYHDRNVKETSFNVGDLVLRHIQKTDGMHKLSAPWEGPFIVTKVISPST